MHSLCEQFFPREPCSPNGCVLYFFLQVYKEPLCRRYYATPCSFAGIYCAGALITLLLTPFFVAYDPYSECFSRIVFPGLLAEV